MTVPIKLPDILLTQNLKIPSAVIEWLVLQGGNSADVRLLFTWSTTQ